MEKNKKTLKFIKTIYYLPLMSLIIALVLTIIIVIFSKCPPNVECAPIQIIRLFLFLWLITFVVLLFGYLIYKKLRGKEI